MAQPSVYFAYPGDLNTLTGGYHYDRRLIEGLRGQGITVHLLSLPAVAPSPQPEALAEIDERVAALPDGALLLVDGLALGVLDKLAQKEAKRLRLVALCHHPLGLEAGLSADLEAQLIASETAALACCRGVIVTSGHTKRILMAQFALPAEKICVALPGTEAVSFAPCNGEPPLLLCIASLIPRKGHDVLIKALSSLADLPWQARLVGGDEFAPQWAAGLRAQVEAAGLEARICFAGAVSDVLPEYQRADVFVLPSRFEGYGMVFAEALAAGLPVVAGRAGAVPDVLQDGDSTAGILVGPEDSAALAEALRELLSDSAVRQHYQLAARRAAGRLPTWSDTAALVATELDRLVRDDD
ncbi:MAG: glycosyltransferase family 4 protein [Pseudomonadales bacterium]|nr:glycosyltransferase family 4 protein [Pseudomonadales bacterium]